MRTLARAFRRASAAAAAPRAGARVYRSAARADSAVRALLRAPPAAQRACTDCAEEQKVQRAATSPAARGADVSSSVAAGTASGGAPLPASARRHFEPRFGRDFSDVRVHTGAEAAASARELNAHAYTFGRDVVFGAGRYDPAGAAGRRLLAHELAHVVQQDSAPELGRRALRQTFDGCSLDEHTRIADAKSADETALDKASQAVQSLDASKLAILDRHFGCGSEWEIEHIRDDLVTLKTLFSSVDFFRCRGAADELCVSQRDSSTYAKGLDLCSPLFPSGSRLKELLFTSAAEGLFGVKEPASYAKFVLELSGESVPASAAEVCDPKIAATRLRTAQRLLSGMNKERERECPIADCGDEREKTVRADLRAAISATGQALSAVGGKLSGNTERLLAWYFTDHEPATVATVRERLGCVLGALQDTLANDRFGCGPVATGYANAPTNEEVCKDSFGSLCIDDSYFAELSSRERMEGLVHECGHRVGLSRNRDPHLRWMDFAFRRLSRAGALANTESYSTFVGAIVQGARLSVDAVGGAAVGGSTEGALVKLHFEAEFQHPSLRGISPTVGASIAWLGGSKDFMGSLLVGARLANPRPGDKGAVYLHLQGGPSLISLGKDSGVGAEAEAKLGYRIGRWDAGVGVGAILGPESDEGKRTTVWTGSLGLSYILD